MSDKLDNSNFSIYDVILASIYDHERDTYSIPMTLYEACTILANDEVDSDDLKKLDVYVIGLMDVKTGVLKPDGIERHRFICGKDLISRRKEKKEVKKDEI